eukprot:2561764-Pyramimonas_sp.AAC.1
MTDSGAEPYETDYGQQWEGATRVRRGRILAKRVRRRTEEQDAEGCNYWRSTPPCPPPPPPLFLLILLLILLLLSSSSSS